MIDMAEVSRAETLWSSRTIQFFRHKVTNSYASRMLLGATFGERLAQARKDAKLSGQSLGDKLSPSVSKQTIAHWEANRHFPILPHVRQLCEILGVSADSLVLGRVNGISPAARALAHAYDALEPAARSRLNLVLQGMEVLPIPH
jgi:transcriptional regulator with XRE-family HTH domain